MKFSGKRNYYTCGRVKELRENLRNVKPKRDGVSPDHVSYVLGDLKAAGHMRIVGFENMETTNEITPTGNGIELTRVSNILKFNSHHMNDVNEAPHLKGYLQSASEADKHRYQIRGWFNSDGTVRIELTTPFKK